MKMTPEQELKALYKIIGLNYDYHQGKNTMKTNIENMYRRSSCLSLIENYLSEDIVCEDTGELINEPLLSWGEDPEKYLNTFKQAIKKFKK